MISNKYLMTKFIKLELSLSVKLSLRRSFRFPFLAVRLELLKNDIRFTRATCSLFSESSMHISYTVANQLSLNTLSS